MQQISRTEHAYKNKSCPKSSPETISWKNVYTIGRKQKLNILPLDLTLNAKFCLWNNVNHLLGTESVPNYPRMDSGPSYLPCLMLYLHNKRYTYFPLQTNIASKVEVFLYSQRSINSHSTDLDCTLLITGNAVLNQRRMLFVL